MNFLNSKSKRTFLILAVALVLFINLRGCGGETKMPVTDVSGADIVINEANFPDPAFRSYVAGQKVDIDQDGALSAGEVTVVTDILLSDKDITSLQGIEIFTALEELHCFDNQLAELDISMLSNLRWLNCADNQLSELDVSKNTNLEWLECYGNQLTALDISKNIKLAELNCRYNQLTALDVSSNTGLISLICSFNQISELDISKNVNLKWLDCANNQLTGLDISNNNSLERLDNSGNKMPELIVDNNNRVAVVYIIALVLALASCAWIYQMIATRRNHASLGQAGDNAISGIEEER